MPDINLFKIEKLDLKSFSDSFLSMFKKKYDKHNITILFIDDEDFAIVSNLKKAGWLTEKIKDLKNIEDDVVKRSQIIFVDHKGVGKTLSENEEGIGIIKALKKAYGDSKRVILYSGYGRFNLEHDIKAADNYLSKNSNTYEFIEMIKGEIKKLR